MSRTIVVDAAIAWAEAAFAPLGHVVLRPGSAITRADLEAADALIVRTVTRVHPGLVAGTPVRFVGTATAGTDHLDVDGLRATGVTVASAPGSNADAVVQWVHWALEVAARRRDGAEQVQGPIGVIGMGFVGRRLVAHLRRAGAEVLVCDPPLAAIGQAPADERDATLRDLVGRERFVALTELVARARVLTLHVPRITAGPHPTIGLLDAAVLQQLRPGTIVINSARGGVVDDDALADLAAAGHVHALLDVYADEPAPAPALVDAAWVATPHIAGYTVEGKRRATAAIHLALAQHLGVAPTFFSTDAMPPQAAGDAAARAQLEADDRALRAWTAAHAHDRDARARAFEAYRSTYAFRRER